MPRISVLFPVHKLNPFLTEALESLITQSFEDFEILFLDNSEFGIPKSVWDIDARIRHVKLNHEFNLADTLNAGIQMSKSEYIARMDYDDISVHNRFEKQISFFESNPNISILGTSAQVFGGSFDDNAKPGTSLTRPESSEQVIEYLLEKNPLIHPTVMFRRSIFDEHQLRYRAKYNGAEDLDLWVRASRKCGIANLQEDLLRYRIHSSQFSREDSVNSVQLSLRCKISHACWVIFRIQRLRKHALKVLLKTTFRFIWTYPKYVFNSKFNKFNNSTFSQANQDNFSS